MTLQNAWYLDKTPPLIKLSSFTELTETDLAKMRSFISITDSRIEHGEVFYYTPNSLNRDIEGDHFPYDSNKPISTAAVGTLTAGGGSARDSAARREKYERQNPDGSTTTLFREGAMIMWYNTTVSPHDFQLVNIDLR